jgi:small subunit ribosomal protein S20
MPTIDSAEKRMRQDEKKRERNKTRKSRVRTAARRFEEALEEGDLEEAEERLRAAESEYDRAVTKGVVPQNRASRKIGRLKKRLHEAKQEE